jgi:hypothetical protein
MKKMKFVSCVLLSIILIGCGGGDTPANIAPEATNKTITLNENQNKQVTLDGTDADGNTLTYKVVKAPSHGTFKNAVYTPTAGYVGSDTFTYVANDGTVDSEPATVTITITADFDGDDISDAIDTDDDNDEIIDTEDVFPLDATESIDTDGDGTGNNADSDDDGDGVIDTNDVFPLDSTESIDTDGDGIGNNADSDDDGDGISDIDEIKNGTNPLLPDTVSILGKIEYERVQPLTSGSTTRLDFNNITTQTAKEVVVEAINSAGTVIATTTTDTNGEYSLTNLPENTSIKIRAYAKMFKKDKWDVKVIDNTNGNAQYVLEGSLVSTGTQSTRRNLKALASTKQSPPFAILDSIYSAMKKVDDADGSVVFPPLKMNWTVNNRESGTYYDGNDNIMIQGDQSGDSDEYDDHIMIHEWGHYFEAKFSRADSIGGSHTSGDHLDIRLAFGEGWGNALSGIVTDDPIYFDTMSGSGWNMNVESATHDTPGWFSEASIQRILYDLYDSNDDGADHLSLGFKPIYDLLTGPQKTTKAFTSLFSFITELKNMQSSDASLIDAIVANESINTIDDIYGRTISPSLYKELTVDSTLSNICVNTAYGIQNKLNNHRYIYFTVNNGGTKTISVQETSGNSQSDPDFVLFKVSPFENVLVVDSTQKSNETKSYNFTSGEYLLDVYDAASQGDICFNVKVGN